MGIFFAFIMSTVHTFAFYLPPSCLFTDEGRKKKIIFYFQTYKIAIHAFAFHAKKTFINNFSFLSPILYFFFSSLFIVYACIFHSSYIKIHYSYKKKYTGFTPFHYCTSFGFNRRMCIVESIEFCVRKNIYIQL